MTDDAGTPTPQPPQGPVLRLNARNFPPESGWNGSHALPVTRQQVLKFAVSLGLTEKAVHALKAGKLPPRLEPVSRAGLYVGSDGVGILTAGECRL